MDCEILSLMYDTYHTPLIRRLWTPH